MSETGKVLLIENQHPALESGDYTIIVEQTVDINDPDYKPYQKTVQKFSIYGPRFGLNPQEIQAAFPPPGSLGDHSNVLPHVLLKRSTLPWERALIPLSDAEQNALYQAAKNKTRVDPTITASVTAKRKIPWLAILSFDEADQMDSNPATNAFLMDQIKTPKTLTLHEIQTTSVVNLPKSTKAGDELSVNVHFPVLSHESGDNGDDSLAVIDVPKKILEGILPALEDLKLLAHVRQRGPDGSEVEQAAVIIGSRLPKQGSSNILHLVSLEGMFDQSSEFIYKASNYDKDLIRLVSLYTWRFACVSDKNSFMGLLVRLNHPLLFSMQALKEITDYLNGTGSVKSMPDSFIQAFLQSNLDPTSISVKDQSSWKISQAGQVYYISQKSMKIYNQAGEDTGLLIAAGKTKSDDVKTSAMQVLKLMGDVKIGANDVHWWLAAGDLVYYAFKEADGSDDLGNLYVSQLESDSAHTLRLPSEVFQDPNAAAAQNYLAMGCVPFHHKMRLGNQTVSWYHGPFVPGLPNANDLPEQNRSADDLMLYDKAIRMFDVSYAAAWELGRLLTLQNRRAALDLFHWKRNVAQSLKENLKWQIKHLPFLPPAPAEFPDSVAAWLQDLALLKEVPFNYLVPDERMLPPESIRFFVVDPLWVESLLDGAFSSGRVNAADQAQEKNPNDVALTPLRSYMTGFLMRSDIVAGWPGLLIDGYRDDKDPASRLIWRRCDRLSKNVLLCLFPGIVQAVDIHLKPETLHFGVSLNSDGNTYNKGEVEIPWKNSNGGGAATRVIDIATLASRFANVQNSAQFANLMIESTDKVRFVRAS
jgi:hypothetical protein